MYNQLLKFHNKQEFFNQFQFGFRYKHSTFMALIILLENLVKALDNGNCAVGIFLDFQKAFDIKLIIVFCWINFTFMVLVA